MLSWIDSAPPPTQARPRGATGDEPGTVVVGLDETRTSLNALDYAAGLARRQGRRLVAVHAHPVRPVGTAFDFAGVIDDELRWLRERIVTLRAEVSRVAEQCALDASFEVRLGEPLRQLVAVAGERGAEVVVIGAPTRPSRWRPPSLAARLTRRCGWPVVVVP